MLRKIGTIHRATDPPFGKKACSKRGDIAIKSVIEVAEARGKIFFGLGGEQECEVTARSEWLRRHGEPTGAGRRSIRESGALAMLSRAYC